MIGIGIPTCLPFYKNTIARAIIRDNCSCCSNVPHVCNKQNGKAGVFGMNTIGGTPYGAINIQGNSTEDREDNRDKLEAKRYSIYDEKTVDLVFPGCENEET